MPKLPFDPVGFGPGPRQHDNMMEMLDSVAETRSARGFARRISDEVSAFEASIGADHDVAINLANFGQSIAFRLTAVGFVEPTIITFHGVAEDGLPVKIVQHMNQVSFSLQAIARADTSTPKTPIGFQAPPK